MYLVVIAQLPYPVYALGKAGVLKQQRWCAATSYWLLASMQEVPGSIPRPRGRAACTFFLHPPFLHHRHTRGYHDVVCAVYFIQSSIRLCVVTVQHIHWDYSWRLKWFFKINQNPLTLTAPDVCHWHDVDGEEGDKEACKTKREGVTLVFLGVSFK